MKALLFDCDGVLVDTERDGHRVAFNRAFAVKGLGVEWSVARYGELLHTAGGKERMRRHFDECGWPPGTIDREALIQELHRLKTDLFMEIVERGELPLRSGVARLIDEARAVGMVLAICSTSNERAVNAIVEKLLGPERKAAFALILAGDVVARKKPDPAIYHLAARRLGVEPEACMVIEDSRNGLLAAKAAGTRCVITTNGYTAAEGFTEADGVFAALGDPPGCCVTLEMLRRLA
jgi:HAD superfamily hydrolase (TIGR01509 family)